MCSSDLDARFRAFPTADGQRPVQNLVCVPLRDELGVSAVLELIDRPGGFTDVEEGMLMDIAAEVAVILRKARLVEELRRERNLQKQLLDVNRTLVSTLELDDVLALIVDAVGQVIEFDAIGIFLVKEDGTIEEVAERGYARENIHLLHQKMGEGLVVGGHPAGHALVQTEVEALVALQPPPVDDVHLEAAWSASHQEQRAGCRADGGGSVVDHAMETAPRLDGAAQVAEDADQSAQPALRHRCADRVCHRSLLRPAAIPARPAAARDRAPDAPVRASAASAVP